MNPPLVTIAIPTYNRADGLLKQALRAAVQQTYANLEIIVSDNCSTDDTAAVVEGFHDPRIKYIRQKENIGAHNNFNFCVNAATGIYFLMLHDDDLIDPDFVEACMQVAGGRTDIGIIRTGTRLIDEHHNVLRETRNLAQGLSTEEFFLSWMRGEIAFYLCSTLFNTTRLQEIGGFQSRRNLFNDVVAEVKLAASHGHADVPGVKASFREHPGEITFATNVRYWCEDSVELLDLICQLVAEDQKATIRQEGARFLSKLNYRLADKVDPVFRKIFAYFTVYKAFGYKYLPPPSLGLRRSLYRKMKSLL